MSEYFDEKHNEIAELEHKNIRFEANDKVLFEMLAKIAHLLIDLREEIHDFKNDLRGWL